jgi:hypothetical protein
MTTLKPNYKPVGKLATYWDDFETLTGKMYVSCPKMPNMAHF